MEKGEIRIFRLLELIAIEKCIIDITYRKKKISLALKGYSRIFI